MDRKLPISTVGRVVRITRKRILISVPLSGVRLRAVVRLLLAISLTVVWLTVTIWQLQKVRKQQHETTSRTNQSTGQAPPTTTANDNTKDAGRKSESTKDYPTWALVVVGTITFFVIGWQAWETRRYAKAASDTFIATQKAASAAKISAETAAKAFQLSSIGYVSVDDLKIQEIITRPTQLELSVAYRIFNASQNPITVSRFAADYGIAGEAEEGISRNVDEFLAPRKGAHFPVTVGPLTPEQRSLYNHQTLMVNIRMQITFVDAVGQQTTQAINRRVICSCYDSKVRSRLWNLDEEATEETRKSQEPTP